MDESDNLFVDRWRHNVSNDNITSLCLASMGFPLIFYSTVICHVLFLSDYCLILLLYWPIITVSHLHMNDIIDIITFNLQII